MKTQPSPFRSIVITLAVTALLTASTSALAGKWRHSHQRHYSHSDDVAYGVLLGALTAFTIGALIAEPLPRERTTYVRRVERAPSYYYRDPIRDYHYRDRHWHRPQYRSYRHGYRHGYHDGHAKPHWYRKGHRYHAKHRNHSVRVHGQPIRRGHQDWTWHQAH